MLLPLPWVCQMTPPSRLADAFLRRLHADELVRARNLLVAGVEDDEVADQVEQPRLVAHLRQRPVEQGAGGTGAPSGSGRRLPFDEELFARRRGAVAQPLRVAAREQQLHGGEERLVEDLFLVGDELAHAVGDLDRAALEFDHRDGDAVEVEHDVRPALVAALERHLLGEREVVLLRVLPVHQMHRLVRLPGGDLHRRRRSAAAGRCEDWPGRA